MRKGRIKIVVDTNWWVSFVINRFKSQLTDLLITPSIHFVTSPELQREIFETLDSPKLSKFIRPDLASEFKAYFPKFTLLVEVTTTVSVCRDSKVSIRPTTPFTLRVCTSAGIVPMVSSGGAAVR